MKTALLLLTATMFCGCMTSNIMAPNTPNVRLATNAEQLNDEVKFKEVYFIWGLIPVNDQIIKDKIAAKEYTVVRVTVQTTFLDYLINYIGSIITLQVQTVIIEGSKEVTVMYVTGCDTCG